MIPITSTDNEININTDFRELYDEIESRRCANTYVYDYWLS